MVGLGGEMEITRRCANHHPSVWGDHFLAYANLSGANEWEEKEHEDQKGGVRKMLVMAPSKSLQKLELINTIQLLGVAYHFEHEIEELLSCFYTCYDDWIGEFGESDLHVVALSFRLLRQQGYYVSSDAFGKFINEQGSYKEELARDVQGLLSLYEAAQFRVHDEEILDEAINFTTTHLKLILPNLSDPLATQVSNALKFPINNIIVRVGTRKYISFYKEDESHSEMLLNFAKLDFNILQRLHKKELCDITRWWKESEIAQALPFARDRVVELYFWSLGVYFVPQYSVARKILTKVLCFCSIMDDTYDTYGTLDELTLLTTAIERWDIDASEQLPPYMKLSYRALLQVYNETERELENLGNKTFRVKYSINEMKKLLKAYFQEAKWYHAKDVPTMEQYIKNGIPSSTYLLLATTSWLGMGDAATKDAFDWISNEPTILVASCIIARLLNDLVTHEIEVERGDVASGIECYMNEHGATTEEAYMEIRKIIEINWKDLNRGCLKPTTVPRVLLMPVLNLTRVAEFFYKDEDAYTFSKNNLKDVISMVLIDPIEA
ncbi:(-)-germacrene D synthase-like [Solanum tuberosum]|uniref:Sesquiterpene synthase n=1 Tax=Solanum tuberosum TaxID=4113 RepID=M1APP8_SOLTU|nr:PREDICTED: (-)-germacrene D synthase-like [Solanum tuberosum]